MYYLSKIPNATVQEVRQFGLYVFRKRTENQLKDLIKDRLVINNSGEHRLTSDGAKVYAIHLNDCVEALRSATHRCHKRMPRGFRKYISQILRGGSKSVEYLVAHSDHAIRLLRVIQHERYPQVTDFHRVIDVVDDLLSDDWNRIFAPPSFRD
jgi:hypothetical protein